MTGLSIIYGPDQGSTYGNLNRDALPAAPGEALPGHEQRLSRLRPGALPGRADQNFNAVIVSGPGLGGLGLLPSHWNWD